jgi:ubiquinone/menaquinone biosynthesis C-methylase UbiE
MSMTVIKYYDELANNYDYSRFENSYGRYIDFTERTILDAWIANADRKTNIDFGCGTGRFLDFAMTGVDASPNMLQVAAEKFPDRSLVQANLTEIPNSLNGFKIGICFHVLMHLDHTEIGRFLSCAFNTISPGGKLILDLLSAPRRQLIRHTNQGWHGNTAFSIKEFNLLCQPYWKITQWRGIILIPIHRIPSFLRPFFVKVDSLLCQTFLARFASYYLLELERLK